MVQTKVSFLLRHSLLIVFSGFLLLSACATVPTDPIAREEYEQRNDPLEPMNRKISSFNMVVNKYIYRPFSHIYRQITPEFVRTGVTNFSTNLRQPVIFVNAILQGDFEGGAQTFGRFFTNTTLGIGGLFDVATKFDIEAPQKDFGQTLYKWGLKQEGPYLVIPFLGPSNVRDTTGMVAGFFIDPVDWALPKAEDGLLWWRYGIQAVSDVNKSTDLIYNLEQSSVDPYATMRTMYRQNRRQFLSGDDESAKENYDFDFPDFEESDDEL